MSVTSPRAYNGICDTYGEIPLTVAFLGNFQNFTFAVASMNYPPLPLYFFCAAVGTYAGLYVAYFKESKVRVLLARNKIGVASGSKLLRSFQFASVAAGLCMGVETAYLLDNAIRPAPAATQTMIATPGQR